METIPGCSHQWEIETAVNDSGQSAGQCLHCGEHRMFTAIFEALPGKQRISTGSWPTDPYLEAWLSRVGKYYAR